VKILVCGSRDWDDPYFIENWFAHFFESHDPESVEVIHGGCHGADIIAGTIAVQNGCKVTEVKADWKRYGRKAGPIRNREMLKLGPELVVAFHDDLTKSKGTADMVRAAHDGHVVTLVLGHKPTEELGTHW